MRLTLELTGLWPYFEGRTFSREAVTRGKPAADLFLLAAETMGADPKRCAVVEDSPLGIEAANAAGMTSFGFAREMPARRLSEATGGIFKSMEELPAFLQRKFNVEHIASTHIDPENKDWAMMTGDHVVNVHCLGNLEPFR